MQTSLVPHSTATFILQRLSPKDLVKATRVCKDWYDDITGKNHEQQWILPRTFVVCLHTDQTSYHRWSQLVSRLFRAMDEKQSMLEVVEITFNNFPPLRKFLISEGIISSLSHNIQTLNQKDNILERLREGFNDAFILYKIDASDYALAERYAKSLLVCGVTHPFTSLVDAVCDKEKSPNYAVEAVTLLNENSCLIDFYGVAYELKLILNLQCQKMWQ